ncbi:type II toxin-antitoxin system HicA family toxin [Thermus sp. PS18]|uniref:type II toxin-antitoxin system HicA family toxin n=1 Tax=Thermus sp. PS18 TaxID=2849039 RepID=UPI002263C14D|nr:type II toxin-antitoxin system HicA family toxin [Thermus sp. PS18]UZX16197.1 type II toxin-antitoxin system HicA family toxin [Thermus sp. PS18]
MARRLRPVSRRELVARLKALGFAGPYTGGRHQFMVRGSVCLVLPNPHRGEISVDLLRRILKQAGIEEEEWLE